MKWLRLLTLGALVSILGYSLTGCGDDATLESACEQVCSCPAGQQNNWSPCVEGCVEDVGEDSPSQSCLDCIYGLSCDEMPIKQSPPCGEVCHDKFDIN